MSQTLLNIARARLQSQGWRLTGGYLVLTTGAEGEEIYSPSGERNLLSDTGAAISVRPEWVQAYTPPPTDSTTAAGASDSGSKWLLALGAVFAFLKLRKR